RAEWEGSDQFESAADRREKPKGDFGRYRGADALGLSEPGIRSVASGQNSCTGRAKYRRWTSAPGAVSHALSVPGRKDGSARPCDGHSGGGGGCVQSRGTDSRKLRLRLLPTTRRTKRTKRRSAGVVEKGACARSEERTGSRREGHS